MSDKTEAPTPKRLRKAREEGDSGVSTQAAQSVAFLVAVALAPAAIAALVAQSSDMMRSAIARAGDEAPSAPDATAFAMPVVLLALPMLLAAGAASAVIQLVQTGGFIASKKLTPKLDRLNVLTGFANLFSSVRAVAVLRALLAGSIVAYLSYRGLRDHASDVAHVAGQLGFVGILAGTVAHGACRDAALFGVAVGAVDLVVTRFSWMKRLRMRKDEVKRETKETEGDPELKARRALAHHAMLASAALANVKSATVVIDAAHIACALRYEEKEGDEAPLVLAVGEGDLAKRILDAARAYGVPVSRDEPLSRALAEAAAGDRIPEELYEPVAEILREAWKP